MPDDLRVPLLGAAAWAGGIAVAALGGTGWWLVAGTGSVAVVGAALVGGPGGTRPAPGRPRWLLALALVALAVATSGQVRHRAAEHGPLRDLGEERAVAFVTGTVASDPRLLDGPWGERAALRLRVSEVVARGATLRLGATVLVLGDPAWADVPLGATVHARGRLAAADDPDLAALLTGAPPPREVRPPDVWWRAAGAVRASVRDAVAHRPAEQRALVPALVDGDDAALPDDLVADFRATGLTHLTAVSGTNLTLLVGLLLVVARTAGVRGRWLRLVAAVGIVGFVLVARTEPSVLRAAAMGTVGLFALGTDGRRRGLRALGVAVVGLLLVAPALAVSAGFALSVLATAGIVLLVPGLTAALGRWLPVPVAGAVAVPLAAQVACTPVVAALSGEVSLVAVAANLAAAPAVGPATVAGLAAGLVGLVWPGGGALLGTLAAWSVAWIVAVARAGAALPGAAIAWGTGPLALAVLVALCLGLALLLPALLRRRAVGVGLAVTLLVVLLGVPGRVWPGSGGWPPRGWLLVACDVGQGDALAVATGPGAALVIDAGPDPVPVARCLDRLGVRTVPLVVLTHFHADHVGGLAGVLRGRTVGGIETTPVLDPPDGAATVAATAREAGVTVVPARYAETRRFGAATVQVLAPVAGEPRPGAGDGSSANDASVVLLVEVGGLRILLTGDVEPPAQARLAATVAGVRVDVLKVPHHGSRYQDAGWLAGLAARLAVISVGDGNDYGHPAPATVAALVEAGAEVARTDRQGGLAVLVDGAGRPVLATER
ncbi:ComEC/Rec2 family competence protein [Nocardioides sp. YIM 152588]|uniref:ComEC/Rec2 family competence protein n=1 Tax=Nocardioides sp. YIM 152588 TaxID=3158259 RepID=UPI0032E51C43